MSYANSIANRRLIQGVGINDADYLTQADKNNRCKYYATWAAMIWRCYSPVAVRTNPTYKDCTVCEEWLTFSNFKAWMEKQDWKGKALDKDLLVIGNKVYSPETCMFVAKKINDAILTHAGARGKYPIGVTAKRDKFQARLNINGSQMSVGCFAIAKEAAKAYCKAKGKYLIRLANGETDFKLKAALLRHSLNYSRGEIA